MAKLRRMLWLWLAAIGVYFPPAQASNFKEDQLRYPHVREAYAQKGDSARLAFENVGLSFPPHRIFWRAFKMEKTLELWARDETDPDYIHVKDFPIYRLSGGLGPKRKDGDRQVPEGFYRISEFYPGSEYYLGLRLNYPSRSDELLGDPVDPGKEVLLHGGYESTGCLAMTNGGIQEIYVVTLEAYVNGQEFLPIHIFPTRLDEAGLKTLFGEGAQSAPADLRVFWANLSEGYRFFEGRRELPVVRVEYPSGRYLFSEP
jgi:murein L,D-transpeptidase YafK